MLFTTLLYILAAIGAVAVVLSVTIGIAYVIVARRLSRSMSRTVADMERMLVGSLEAARANRLPGSEQLSLVPPMRIHLEPASNAWDGEGDALVRRIDDWLRQHSFELVGDFIIEELAGERLRVFLSQDRYLVAAIRQSPDAGEPYVEFCMDLGKGHRGGVSNPPCGTLQLPSDAIGSFHDVRLSEHFEQLSRMWLEAKELTDEHDVRVVDTGRIAEFYEEAHACEMDFRMAQGGVSEDEIRSAFAAQGVVPSVDDVAEIQEQWQLAIEHHLLDFSARAQNHHYAGGHILIVHNGSVQSYLLHRIVDMLDEVEGLEGMSREEILSTISELRILLNRFSPREAMARFRPLLPKPVRYNLVDQLKQPIEADLYLLQPSG